MYLTLEKAKKQLNIDDQFTDDDNYILDLIEVVEQIVERHIDFKLDILAGLNGGNLPKPVEQAMLLQLGTLYENRESVAYASSSEVPLSYSYILSLYKNYKHNMYNV